MYANPRRLGTNVLVSAIPFGGIKPFGVVGALSYIPPGGGGGGRSISATCLLVSAVLGVEALRVSVLGGAAVVGGGEDDVLVSVAGVSSISFYFLFLL